MLTRRTWGSRRASAPTLVLLHGGPGAPGGMGGLGEDLAERFHAVELFQRTSRERDGGRLDVARHIEDLNDALRALDAPTILIGSSWGAMLALAYAAAFAQLHPHAASPAVMGIVLIGSGTFDEQSRQQFRTRLSSAMTDGDRIALMATGDEATSPSDADNALREKAEVFDRIASVDLVHEPEVLEIDAAGHDETWDDMIRLQQTGIYPRVFSRIRQPVLMLHGADDPHPGPATRDTLRQVMPQLEYHEFPRCGHYPWLERHAREAFHARLRSWIERVSSTADLS